MKKTTHIYRRKNLRIYSAPLERRYANGIHKNVREERTLGFVSS